MKTIKQHSTFLFKDKGSKFYAYAFPLNNKEDVKEHLAALAQEHPKARHFCYAFLWVEKGEEYFIVNDDGEPNNSAGMPILGQIRSHELSHTLVVVVRYFGGTKLGISGLINAYKEATKGALNENQFTELVVTEQLTFVCDYNQLSQVMVVLHQGKYDYSIEQQEQVWFKINVGEDEIEQLSEKLSRLGSFR